MRDSNLFHMVFLFWVVMDALGNVPIFVSILKPFETAVQRKIIMRELIIALLVMVAFLFFGHAFFHLFHIRLPSLEIAGGIILFIIAIGMIFSSSHSEKSQKKVKEPFIVPLAIPAVAGPGILATITLYGGSGDNKFIILAALFIAWLLLFPFLYFSSYLKKFLGDNGLIAAERLFGYLIVLISVKMALHGLTTILP